MLTRVTSSELFKQSKVWLKTAVQSVKNLVAKFTGAKLREKELKNLHAKPNLEQIKKFDRSKLSVDEIKFLDLKLGEMSTLCKKVLPRSGDVGLFFTSPENPKDPFAKLMDTTVFNLMRKITADKSNELDGYKKDGDLINNLGEEFAKIIPVHVGAIVNNNGKFEVIQSDFRGIKNKLRIEDLEDFTYRSITYGSNMSLYPAGYTNSPSSLVNKYRSSSDQYNYSIPTVLGRGVNLVTNGLLNQVLDYIAVNRKSLIDKIRDSKIVDQIQSRLSEIRDNSNSANIKSLDNKETNQRIDTICVDFIIDDLLKKIIPNTNSRSLIDKSNAANRKSQMTPIALERFYQIIPTISAAKRSEVTENRLRFTSDLVAA